MACNNLLLHSTLFQGHQGSILCVVFHRDMLISGGHDKNIRFWKWKVKETRGKSRLLSTASIGKGRESSTVKPYISIAAHEHMISALCIYIDVESNLECVISSSWDKTVKVWNLISRKLVFNLQGHQNRVKCLALVEKSHSTSINNSSEINIDRTGLRLLFSGDDDGTIIGWNLRNGCKVYSLQDQSNSILHLATSKALERCYFESVALFSHSCDGSLRCWNQSNHNHWNSTQINNNLCNVASVHFFCLETKFLRQFYHSTANMQPKTTELIDDGGELSLLLLTTNDGKLLIMDGNTGFTYCEFLLVSSVVERRDIRANKVVRGFIVENADLTGLFPVNHRAKSSSKDLSLPQPRTGGSEKALSRLISKFPTACTSICRYSIIYVLENGDLGYLVPSMDNIDILSSKFSLVRWLRSGNSSTSSASWGADEDDFPVNVSGAFLGDSSTGSTSRRLVVYGSEGLMICVGIPISRVEEDAPTMKCFDGVDVAQQSTSDLPPTELPPIATHPDNKSNEGVPSLKTKRVNFHMPEVIQSDGSQSSENPKLSTSSICDTSNGSFWTNLESRQYSFSRLKLYSRSSELIPMPKDLSLSDPGEESKNIARTHRLKKKTTTDLNQGQMRSYRHRILDPLLISSD